MPFLYFCCINMHANSECGKTGLNEVSKMRNILHKLASHILNCPEDFKLLPVVYKLPWISNGFQYCDNVVYCVTLRQLIR